MISGQHYLVVQRVPVRSWKDGEYYYRTDTWFPEVCIPIQTSLDGVLNDIVSGQYDNIHSVLHLDLDNERCSDCSRLIAELILDRAEVHGIALNDYTADWLDQHLDLSFAQKCRLRGLDPREESANNAADAFVKNRKATA